MSLYFEIAGDQIDGDREYQEDAFLTTYIEPQGGDSKSSGLVIMADGMGGHAAGNIASNLVVSAFNKMFTGGFGHAETPELLRRSLLKANEALHDSIRETPALSGMGCTMVSVAFSESRVWWVSVGDSHLYLLRDGELIKKNEDHSYGGYLDRMRAQGLDLEDEPGFSRNMLMSAMMGDDIAEIDCPEEPFTVQAGDRLVIASDGLDTVSGSALAQLATRSETPKACVDALLKAVAEAHRPRQDNTTVIVVDVREKAESSVVVEPATPAVVEPPAAPPPTSEFPAPEPQAVAAAAVGMNAGFGGAVAAAPARVPGRSSGYKIGVAAAALAVVVLGVWFMLARDTEPPQLLPPAPSPAAVPAPDAQGPQSVPAAAPAPGAEKSSSASAPGVAAPSAEQSGSAAKPVARAAPKEFRDGLEAGGEGPMMVEIPAGHFAMGSSRVSMQADERPRHTVTVPAFAMSRYELTFAQYDRFARATGRALPQSDRMDRETYPVVDVSWDDALAYARWLSEQTGHEYRLPSEAQWEYAAGAGADTPYWWGFDAGQGHAYCFGCTKGLAPRMPTRIGRFPPNGFGLYDTAGNVAEWVADCYHPNYQGAPTDGSVWKGGDCTYRVVRGGSYSSPPPSLRTASRDKLRAASGYDFVGIRLVRALEP